MDTSLASVIDLYALPTGRRLFAHAQVLKRAAAAKLPDIVKHVNAAIARCSEDLECLDAALLERRTGERPLWRVRGRSRLHGSCDSGMRRGRL